MNIKTVINEKEEEVKILVSVDSREIKNGTFIIPEGINVIGDRAFYNCPELTTVIIPETVTKIENKAFTNCTNLINIQLPNNLTYIGDEAFKSCDHLENLIIKDYMVPSKTRTAEEILENIRDLSHEELAKSQVIAKMLGYEDFDNYDEVGVFTKGYRVLNKIPRMPSNIVENLVKTFKSFQHILAADIPALDAVEGIGEVRARAIRQSLRRMQEQFVFDNLML